MWRGFDLLGSAAGLTELGLPGWQAVLDPLKLAGSQYATPRDTGGRQATGPITLTMVYDDTALIGSNLATVGLPQDGAILISLKGNTALVKTIGAAVDTVSFTRTPAPELLTRVSAELSLDGPMEEPVLLRAWSLLDPMVTGNTDGASYDSTAGTTNGGSMYFQVSSLVLDGATSISGVVRHSTDNITFAALVTSTAVTAHPAGERKTVTGTVNRYLSAGYTLTGAGGGGEEATFAIAFHRNP